MLITSISWHSFNHKTRLSIGDGGFLRISQGTVPNSPFFSSVPRGLGSKDNFGRNPNHHLVDGKHHTIWFLGFQASFFSHPSGGWFIGVRNHNGATQGLNLLVSSLKWRAYVRSFPSFPWRKWGGKLRSSPWDFLSHILIVVPDDVFNFPRESEVQHRTAPMAKSLLPWHSNPHGWKSQPVLAGWIPSEIPPDIQNPAFFKYI